MFVNITWPNYGIIPQFLPPCRPETLVFLYQISYPGARRARCEGYTRVGWVKTAKNAWVIVAKNA